MARLTNLIKKNYFKKEASIDIKNPAYDIEIMPKEKAPSETLNTLNNIINGRCELTFDPDKTEDEMSKTVAEVVNVINRQKTKELKNSVKLSMQASEVFSFISFVSSDSHEVSTIMTSISSAIEELNASIKQIAQVTEQISNDASRTRETSENGLTATENAVESMHGIKKTVDIALNKIKELNTASEQIGSILEVIEDIADKTNLLALNATIEAARAGDAGKGFAVVAGEVKGLSSQTAKATEQIRQQISSIRENVKQVGDIINETSKAVEIGNSNIDAVSYGIKDIAKHIDGVTASIADTSASITQQTSATQEVVRSVSIIEGKTRLNQENAEKSLKAVMNMEHVLAETFKALEEKNIKGSVVEFAKSDHFTWKRKLAEMLAGSSDSNSSVELRDHHSCRLGKWYENIKDSELRNHPAFTQLEQPHASVHQHGKKMAELFKEGKKQEAMKEYEKMDEASKEVVSILDQLSKVLIHD